jgi:hypothetical protein
VVDVDRQAVSIVQDATPHIVVGTRLSLSAFCVAVDAHPRLLLTAPVFIHGGPNGPNNSSWVHIKRGGLF